MGSRRGNRDGEDTLIEALGISDSQHVLPTKGSLGEYSSTKQGREEASLSPTYYSDEFSVRITSNNGRRECEIVFNSFWESTK